MTENKVKLEIFEGPLDLLLYLVRKEEVDIYQVNLTKIATQFVEYVEVMREMDLEIAGEFIVMASTLMYIKSKELLPVEQQAQVEDEDEGEDPRWELIRQLVEYKKFKDAAAQLQHLEAEQENVYRRIPPKVEFERDSPLPKPEVSLFDLIHAVNTVLKRYTDRHPTRDIYEERWSVSEKIETLRSRAMQKPKMKFSELFEEATSRGEVVVTFLALLELIRLKQLRVVQPEAFSEIEIEIAPPTESVLFAPTETPAEPAPDEAKPETGSAPA
ncbi:MAG TPA: segregation/condensation protein A [Methylomirabilota bacterium]|nr:segregation/condensation protein A [Methylomirabilota bacterium]